MPSAEFARIVKDLAVIGETCTIECTKEGVKFSVSGDLGTGNIMVRNNSSVEKEEVRTFVSSENKSASTQQQAITCLKGTRQLSESRGGGR